MHIPKRDRFDFAFTTDGVGCRIQVTRIKKKNNEIIPNKFPKRGIWAIDELKKVTRSGNVHVIGIDPGKRELICATDMKKCWFAVMATIGSLAFCAVILTPRSKSTSAV